MKSLKNSVDSQKSTTIHTIQGKNLPKMNDITIFVYFITFAAVLGASFAFMWRSMSSVLMTLDTKPSPKYNIHPEMDDVKDGEELLVFKSFEQEET